MEIEYIPERPISIYALRCPIEDVIKYIGASYDVERRFRSHLTNKWPNKKMKEWFEEMAKLDLVPTCETLETLDLRIDAVQRELFYIEKYRDTILNYDRRLKLPSESISSSKDDKYKISFYFTREQAEIIIKSLRRVSASLDWSFYTVISSYEPKYSWNNTEKIKWINTPDSRKIN